MDVFGGKVKRRYGIWDAGIQTSAARSRLGMDQVGNTIVFSMSIIKLVSSMHSLFYECRRIHRQ